VSRNVLGGIERKLYIKCGTFAPGTLGPDGTAVARDRFFDEVERPMPLIEPSTALERWKRLKIWSRSAAGIRHLFKYHKFYRRKRCRTEKTGTHQGTRLLCFFSFNIRDDLWYGVTAMWANG
jgi:hypothetical protein